MFRSRIYMFRNDGNMYVKKRYGNIFQNKINSLVLTDKRMSSSTDFQQQPANLFATTIHKNNNSKCVYNTAKKSETIRQIFECTWNLNVIATIVCFAFYFMVACVYLAIFEIFIGLFNLQPPR